MFSADEGLRLKTSIIYSSLLPWLIYLINLFVLEGQPHTDPSPESKRCIFFNLHNFMLYKRGVGLKPSTSNIGQTQILVKFLNLFVTNNLVQSYNTGRGTDVRPYFCRTNAKFFSILFQGPKIWNSLPNDIKQSETLILS